MEICCKNICKKSRDKNERDLGSNVNATDAPSVITRMTMDNDEYIQHTGSRFIVGSCRSKVPGEVGIYFRDPTGKDISDQKEKKEITFIDFISKIKSKRFLHYFRLYFLIFIFSFIISIIIGLKYNFLSDGTIYFVSNYTSLKYGNGDMLDILANNFIISLIVLYYFYYSKPDRFKRFIGLFQFAYLGTIGGLVVSKAIIKYNLIIALSAIVPHGIIEIPTVVFAISMGWVLSELKDIDKSQIDKDEQSKIDKKPKVPRELIYASITLFILLSISAYIESYVTPEIFNILVAYYK